MFDARAPRGGDGGGGAAARIACGRGDAGSGGHTGGHPGAAAGDAACAGPLAGLGGILERLAQDFEPASGAVGAYRWAESILGQYLADGRDTASALAAGAAYAARYGENDAALRSRLETVQTAAETLASGQELGLVRDRRLLTAGWESGEVEALFTAIAAGAHIE